MFVLDRPVLSFPFAVVMSLFFHASPLIGIEEVFLLRRLLCRLLEALRIGETFQVGSRAFVLSSDAFPKTGRLSVLF